ncbi:hypothetical protein ACQPZ8_19220 [Actinomadura nitritigenes]|uniref:hypothetical protein n=1 Tax=Actinomadura nitritigenes TaxID=134602 RepID=UPI003D933A69
MELIVTLVVAFPLGFFVRSRAAACIAYIAVHSFVFSFQNTELVREWSGGDYSAFPKDPGTMPWSYVLVNAVIYAAGFGLVTLGHAVRARLRRRNARAVDLAH